MKKISLLTTLLAATVATAATAAGEVASGPCCPKAFQGFHVQGILGYGTGYGNHKSRHDFNRSWVDGFGDTITAAGTHRSKSKLGFSGVSGGLGLGYTHRFGNMALGLNFDALWSNVSGKHRYNTNFSETETTPAGVSNGGVNAGLRGSHKVHLKNSLQLYGRAGYVLGMAMPWVGLGWDSSSWGQNTRARSTYAAIPPATIAAPTSIAFSGSKSKRVNSLLVIVGADWLATKHLVLSTEWRGAFGGNINHNHHHRQPNVRARHDSSVKVRTNTFLVTAKVLY